MFAARGSYASPQAFVDGMTAALPIGAAVLAVGSLLALLIPAKRLEREPRRALAEAL